MEKIQSAIAKARAARSRTGEPVGDAALQPVLEAVAAASAPRPAAEVEAAWAALPEVHFSPKLLQRNRIVTYENGREAIPFDVMRTRFLQQMRANGWRRVAITSPRAACGKSTIAVNLALSLARQPDLRIVLAEVDLRRPSIAKMLGIHQRHAFGDVLGGSSEFSDNAVRHGANLAIATTHGPLRNAAEMLQSSRVADALSLIEEVYDPSVLIFDLPPMLVGDDMMAFADRVDCALLIAADRKSVV